MANIKKIKLPNGTEYDIKDSGALPLTGGTITGPVIFQDTTSMDEATIGDLVVNGNASFTNNIQANTINGVAVGSSPKFTDTITTATTTGSGNAVTAVTASNGALTITKGATFLTSHQDISGKADKATTLAGYGITDAKISSGTITLGSNTITPLTSSSTLNAAKLSGAIPSAVTATTQASTDNSTKIATTAFVQAAMSSAGAGTVTSVGVSNATNGGLTISGSPITSSGTISIGHSNVLASAQTTQAVYPIKIDKNGHISAYGNAVTIPTKTSDLTNDSGFITSYTDEKVKVNFVTGDAIYYLAGKMGNTTGITELSSHGSAYVIVSRDIDTIGGTYLALGNSIDQGTAGSKYGAIRLFSRTTKSIDLRAVTTLSNDRTIDLPDKNGTIALTDDVPTITLNGSSTTSPSFYAPTSAGTSGYVLTSTGSGAPGWYSGALTDNKVTSTAVTAVTTTYLVGSTNYSTETGDLTKHASASLHTTADSGTGGHAQLQLGNTTATSSAGGKEGQIKLYGTTATYYVDLKAGAPSANRTITLPDKTGTIALTDDIPTVPSNIVNTITTTAGAHTTITNQKGNVSFSIPTTAAHVGAAASDHTHGNITNGGDITATAPTIASGDQIIINDNSASKITNGPTFDGSTTTKALTPKGTWETFLKSYTETDPTVPSWAKASTKPSYTASEVGALPDTTTIPSNTSDLNNDSGFITLSDVPDISSLIIVDTHTPTGYEFTSSQNRSITINLQSHSGYTPYALRCVCTNKTSIRIYNYYISSGTIVFEAINTTSSKVTGVNFNIQILWIKNTILGS